MFTVKPTLVTLKRISTVRWLRHWGRGNALSVPLFPAFADPQSLLSFKALDGYKFRMDKPPCLRQKGQKKQCCKKLRGP